MVDLVVWVNAKKINLEVINQIQFGLLVFFGGTTTVHDKRFDQP